MYTEKRQHDIAKKYADEMSIIKQRIEQIFSAREKIGYLEPAVEFKALQLRKVIEQILLASLIANSDEYQKFYSRLGSEWKATYIGRDLKRVNPDFFPKPVNNREDFVIEDVSDGLSSDEILTVYDQLGKYLHSKNPFNSQEWDYESLSNKIDYYTKRIIQTLNCHIITLYGGDVLLNVVMKSKDHGGKVWVGWAEKCSEEEQRSKERIISEQIARKNGGQSQ